MPILNGIESQITRLTANTKSLIHECVTGQRRISQADLAAMKRPEVDPPELHQI